MDKNLVALYELKRQSLLLAYVQDQRLVSEALAFAYMNRVAPILHENIAREVQKGDPFEDVHSVKADFVEAVLIELDTAENDEALGFYNLEDHFGGREVRIDLLHALEYIRISGRFDEKVWQAVEANAPAEAKQIDATFPPSEVQFY